MEELLVKVSEILGMSVDGLMNYYPELRSQLMMYGMLNSIINILLTALLISPLILATVYVVVDMTDYDYWEDNLSTSVFIKMAIGFLILVLLMMVVSGLKYVFATDIMMIRHLL